MTRYPQCAVCIVAQLVQDLTDPSITRAAYRCCQVVDKSAEAIDKECVGRLPL